MDTAIFTTIEGVSAFFLLQEKELAEACFDLSKTRDVGKVYLGRISEIVPNLRAAFVEYKKGTKAFLPLSEEELKTLHCEQVIPVQVNKEAVKTKSAVLTRNIVLSGLYSVVTMNGANEVRVSKKIKGRHAEVLAQLASSVDPKGHSVVIRTNADALFRDDTLEDHGKEIWMTELDNLMSAAERMQQYSEQRTMYSLLWEPDFTCRMLAKSRLTDLEKVVTNAVNIGKKCKDVLITEDRTEISLYTDTSFPLLSLYELKAKLHEALGRKVWLKSGGYLVFDSNETLSTIDVNSGKDQSKITKQELIHKTNKEAAIKIATQLRCRNLSGMILIDFMNGDQAEQTSLMNRMHALVLKDSVKTNVIDITGLQLMELTRKKDELSLVEQCKEAGLYETFAL
ncbi:MAG: ribonuclease E/G [Lachnospiraceae bacterium]|nr:ribonuclease E/G [Lachnospiraceae bacterium]